MFLQSQLYEIKLQSLQNVCLLHLFKCISQIQCFPAISLIQSSIFLSPLLSFFLFFHLNNVLSLSDKNTVSKRAFGSLWECQSSSFISLSYLFLSPSSSSGVSCLLFYSSSSDSFSPSIFPSFPPNNYLQDYRFSVGCD